MLKWYKNLYKGDTVKRKAPEIIRKVNHGKLLFDIYLVTIASNQENLLEIISANQLRQKYIRQNCPEIVGIADTYWEALEVVMQIVTETYQKQGDADVRRYLESREVKKNRNRSR